MSTPSFSLFRRRQIIFEVKYDPAYAIWDRAGYILRQFEKNFEEIETVDASPDRIQVILDKSYTVTIHRTSSSVTAPGSVSRQSDIVDKYSTIYKIIESGLFLRTLKRIGFRHIWVRKYGSIESAVEDCLSFGLMKYPKKKVFGIEPKSANPHYKMEIDNDILGVIFQLYAATRSLNVNFTPDVEDFGAKIENEKLFELNIDVDFFTKKSTECESFVSEKHLAGWYRAIQNGVEDFVRYAS